MPTNMPGKAAATGAVLMALGFAFYALSVSHAQPGHNPVTAMIPAVIGLPILVLGLVARNPLRRKQAMHFAAVDGLIGALGGLSRGASKWPLILTGQSEKVELPLAAWETLLMFLICAAFVFACAKSFRDVRRTA